MKTSFSPLYASAYDLLNEGKPYKEEIEFVQTLFTKYAEIEKITSVLDLGCGSGKHLSIFPSSILKTGVDISDSMLEIAADRDIPNTQFFSSNIGDFRSNTKFSLIYSLFHVMSYQTTETELISAFKTMRDHLSHDGLAVFDFWHRPPWDIERISSPVFDRLSGMVSIDMDIFVNDSKARESKYSHFSERHVMRAYTLQELEFAAKLGGMQIVGSGPWMNTNRKLSASDWYGWAALRPFTQK
jgi:SAM-dependent methyltransferase